jgi:hypothetical protein
MGVTGRGSNAFSDLWPLASDNSPLTRPPDANSKMQKRNSGVHTYFKPARRPAHRRCDRFFGQDYVLLKSTLSASVIGQNPTWATNSVHNCRP